LNLSRAFYFRNLKGKTKLKIFNEVVKSWLVNVFPRKFYCAFLKITFVRLGNNNAYLPLRAFRNADRTQVTDNLSSARTFLLHCRNGQICEAVTCNANQLLSKPWRNTT